MSDGKNVDHAVPAEFDWVKLKAELDAPHVGRGGGGETFKEKFNRKFKENPVVPIGCLMTAAALTYGLISFRKGDQKTSQLMMRIRVGAQGFTVAALLGGIFYTAMKTPAPNST